MGAATARAASAGDARVVLAARREDRIKQMAEELGDAVPVRCDVTDPKQVAAAVDAATSAFGRLDILVNNAGQGLQASIEDTDPDDFRALIELNLVAPLLTMQAVIPVMRDQGAGTIVNVSSGTTFSVIPESGAYAASKAGLNLLSSTVRVELQSVGITVSTMYPFVTGTEFVDAYRAGKEAAAEMLANSGMEVQPPELVAETILDLIKSGAEQADLVPPQFGGTYNP